MARSCTEQPIVVTLVFFAHGHRDREHLYNLIINQSYLIFILHHSTAKVASF